MINSPLDRQSSVEKELLKDEDFVTIHHNLMMVYGWIPLDEFKEIPIPTLLSLSKMVYEEINKSEILRLYTLKFYGVKNPK